MELHLACLAENLGRPGAAATHFWFRAGVAVGAVRFEDRDGRRRVSSADFTDASAHEAEAKPGEILMTDRAWRLLPDHLAELYDPPEDFADKNGERFVAAHRLRLVDVESLTVRRAGPSRA